MAEYSSKREERKDEITQREDILVGRNAVSEALRSGRTIDKVFAASGDTDHGLRRLCCQAKQAGAVISMTDRRKLDQMVRRGRTSGHHCLRRGPYLRHGGRDPAAGRRPGPHAAARHL